MNDLRFAARTMRRDPWFTAIAVLCIALGIGATSTVFGIVDALFFREPPGVADPAALIRPYITVKSQYLFMRSSTSTSYPVYADLRDNARTLAGLAAYSDVDLSVGHGLETRHADGQLVTANYFSVLGVRPARGRALGPVDVAAGAAPVAIVSHAYWQAHMAGRRDALGQQLLLDGRPFTVVGIAPPDFAGVDNVSAADIWVPASPTGLLGMTPAALESPAAIWLQLVGRLAPGVTPAQARAELEPLLTRSLQATNGRDIKPHLELGPIIAARGPAPSTQATIARWLALAAGLVLAIACANTANLLLARGAARRREMAIRLAVGAARARLSRQLLTESVALALFGALGGVILALWTSDLVPAAGLPPLHFLAQGRVLVFAIVVSVASGILFGLAPALAASRSDLASAMKNGAREGRDHRSRLRDVLVVAQVSLAAMLLVGAGLFVRSLRNVQAIQPGIDVGHLLVGSVDLESTGYNDTASAAFFDRALERLRTVPGVRSATLASIAPLAGGFQIVEFSVPGGASGPKTGALDVTAVMQGGGTVSVEGGPDYLGTVGTPLLEGRDFTTRDRPGAPPAIIVNEAFAKREWPHASALGQCVKIGSATDGTCYTVVGVAAEAKYANLEERGRAAFFTPIARDLSMKRQLLIRTTGDPSTIIPAVRKALVGIEPNLPYLDLQTLTDLLRPELQPRRLGASMFGAFGLMALLLTAIGLYGVVSFAVAQRTREVGLRMALGAQRRSVLLLVLRHGIRLTAVGLLIGIAGAVGGARLISHLLYGVTPADAGTFAGVALVLAATAVVATLIPARRATRVDPVVALRSE